ncbi:MAG TPA: DUF2207 domain-containing protein [Caulobacterales bacterium]|nr:DUF2207 domain-containing protein [Caulobacterales bacterium]
MNRLCAALLSLIALTFAAPALAKEQIDRFDVVIDVATSGDIVVTETIDVEAEGDQIRHGIFRDLPRYYEQDGDRLPYQYSVQSITLDGHGEHYETANEDNAFRIRIGDADTTIPTGAHEYVLRYRVKNQVRYFDRYDEVYWNATGNYWAFPIAQARATINLPHGADVIQHSGYTGALGEKGDAFSYAQSGDSFIFTTTQPLAAGEGLTVAVGFEKGLIAPPSEADRAWLWWQRNGALAVLVASLGGLFWFLYRSFIRVGRDPQKGPVFPRYEAPEGYSPAATHYIYNRGLSGHRALIATLMNLAVKGRITVDASDKKSTTLHLTHNQGHPEQFAEEDQELERNVFAGLSTKVIGGKYDPEFTEAYTLFKAALSRKYGRPYFRWNAGYTILSALITIGVVIFAIKSSLHWTVWHTAAVLALAALNGVFMYLMPAPTPQGQQVRTEIEGFRLYMNTAEKLALNAVKVGSDAPPPMTTERYETFLPYAVALGVEAPWTRHFEHALPQEAAAYHPAWTTGAWAGSHSFSHMNEALISNLTSGVTSALPQSSSSSGSGGGGSSGGGGGGGGGGGW